MTKKKKEKKKRYADLFCFVPLAEYVSISWICIIKSYHAFLSWVRIMDSDHGFLSWNRIMPSYRGFVTCIRSMDWVYSHPFLRHSAGVPVKNRVAVSPFHRYLERVYSHSVFHTSPGIYTETYVWLHSRLCQDVVSILERVVGGLSW